MAGLKTKAGGSSLWTIGSVVSADLPDWTQVVIPPRPPIGPEVESPPLAPLGPVHPWLQMALRVASSTV